MNTKCKVLMILFLFTMVCVSDVYAPSKYEIESLRGIKGIHVVIESLNPDIEKDGLRIENIQTDVELKLRLAGFKVLTEKEWLNEPGEPYLYVNVNSMKHEIGTHVFKVDIGLIQTVHLKRDTKIFLQATTWSSGIIGYVEKEKGVNYVRDSVKDLMDEFINDYLSVNPK